MTISSVSNETRELHQIVSECTHFDPDWYCAEHLDVNLTGMDPAEHFCKFGAILRRSPGPFFDTRFCQDTYADIGTSDENPLSIFFKADEYTNRPVTLQQLSDLVVNEKKIAEDNWPHCEARTRNPIISYCIPIMGRLEDVMATMRHNLDENRRFEAFIEFLVIDFGTDNNVESWIKKNFTIELESGYLRIVADPHTLDSWHFGKAKNSFKSHMHGQVYSSLDGDNFVTWEETAVLLDIVQKYPLGFIFHHFSGKWGDGTSGRISAPVWLYKNVGYNSRLMPRQFDEMDFILGCLKRYPSVPFIGVDDTRNAFTLSVFCGEFRKTEMLPNKFVYIGDCRHIPPINPRGENYTDVVLHWRDMNNFNASFSAINHIKNDARKERHKAQLFKHKLRLIESIPIDEIISTVFDLKHTKPIEPVTREDICLFVCVHDEEKFLRKFINHYRSLGVSRFFIIDDHSAVPVNKLSLGDDVASFIPKVGDFSSSKTLWLESVMKAYIPHGTWALTVDADEFIHLPYPHSNLNSLIDRLESQGRSYTAGILLDMLPNPAVDSKVLADSGNNFLETFDQFCNNTTPPSNIYTSNPSVKWAFGPQVEISWRFDARYHLFGTFDSLRKVPFFKYDGQRHLNQGFHTFHFTDPKINVGSEIWNSDTIIPIAHYKLTKLFSDAARFKMLEVAGGYHSRTAGNISKIFSESSSSHLNKLSSLREHFLPSSQLKKLFNLSDTNRNFKVF